MEIELLRLSTFASFPKTSQAYSIRLAEVGFTYSGVGDEVKCPDCNLHYRNWNNEDLPLEIHKRLSPKCTFVVTKNNTKQSVNGAEKFTTPQQPTQEEEHSKSVYDLPSSDFIQRKYSDTNFTNSYNQLFTNLGISCTKPKHPEYAIMVVRITSYRKWPRHLPQSPKEMAQAGFFYTDTDDLVRCFHCGGGLTNWEKDDDPFVEHAHWFPECIFLRQCKGDEFINQVKILAKQQMEEDLLSKTNDQSNSQTSLANTHSSENSSSYPSPTSVAIESVIEMGYSLKDAQTAIENCKAKSGNKNYSASDIMKCLLEFEEKGQLVTSSVDTNQDSTREGSLSNELLHISEKEGQISRSNTSEFKDVKILQEENKHLRDRTLCKVCMEEPVSMVFLPCGHLATCHQCAPALKTCPLCRKFIKGTVKTFLV